MKCNAIFDFNRNTYVHTDDRGTSAYVMDERFNNIAHALFTLLTIPGYVVVIHTRQSTTTLCTTGMTEAEAHMWVDHIIKVVG